MSWVRSDDAKPLNRKVRPLSDAAYRLDDHALHYCARHETDGLIHQSDFEEITLGLKGKQHPRYVQELVAAGLWHPPGEACLSSECPAHVAVAIPGSWVKHDYFVYNKAHSELEALRVADRERKRKRVGIPAAVPVGIRPESNGSPITPSRPVPSRPIPSPNGAVSSGEETVAPAVPDAGPFPANGSAVVVTNLLQEWVHSLSSGAERDITSSTQAGEKRRKLVLSALRQQYLRLKDREAAVVAVGQALVGHRWDDWEGRPGACDVEDCLRPKNFEKFRDWERGINRPVRKSGLAGQGTTAVAISQARRFDDMAAKLRQEKANGARGVAGDSSSDFPDLAESADPGRHGG
jgi:hypothetical protein